MQPKIPNKQRLQVETTFLFAACNDHADSAGLLIEAGVDKDLATLEAGATALAFQLYSISKCTSRSCSMVHRGKG